MPPVPGTPPPLLDPGRPASKPGSPPLLEPPAPPSRSRQQCVDALHDESHGAPAWISWIFESSFARSLPKEQAGTLLPPLLELVLDVLPPLDEPEDDPDDDEEEEEVDDVLPPAGCCGRTVLV